MSNSNKITMWSKILKHAEVYRNRKIKFRARNFSKLKVVAFIISLSLLLTSADCQYRKNEATTIKVKVKKNIYYYTKPKGHKDPSYNKHCLDVYYPDRKGNHPVVIFIHGGSWSFGDRSWYTYLANSFAKEGIVSVIVSYRLSPQHKHPSQMEDVTSAIFYVFKNIHKYNGNPEDIYLCGHSAGAHISSYIFFNKEFSKTHNLDIDKLKGVILISGVYDFSRRYPVSNRHKKAIIGTFGSTPEELKEASPVTYITDYKPELFICYAERDIKVLKIQSKELAHKLDKKKLKYKIKEVPVHNHFSEIIFTVHKSDPLRKEILNFIKGSPDNEIEEGAKNVTKN
ncbi:alpha/beta hydrolase [Candidatus Dependentiae bacterium]|nr:alpha/beta hydrolase [Candidatus Dependentiae bacterium]